MAGDTIPSIPLDKPEDPKRPLQQDSGCGAFFGLAACSYFSGTAQLEKQRQVILQSRSIFGMRSRRFGITGISLGLVGMGLWRAFN
ncbi:hypothetical protein E4U16_006407 [Claviceps sp. LM84 group G4]|nr:hypothetical protein E4U16_006407 [Claviceps sp. LM84 group G4]